MLDVLIVGAGPAGAVAGTVLARAGARVRLLDRATFPRDKLCGDTVNPGTIACLKRLALDADLETRGLRVDGMRVTGEGGVAIDGYYPHGQPGRAILRRDLDWMLLRQAIAAGCDCDTAVAVRRATVDDTTGAPRVTGVIVGANGGERAMAARVIIAADGRHSAVAFSLGLASHPKRPRRWAIGGYLEGVGPVADAGTLGEMHVRRNRYIGVAPVPGGLTNVCLVCPSRPADRALSDPTALLTGALARDTMLRDRFVDARLVARPVVLGPLAVDVPRAAIDGLLLAGDAAGFIDPMTGDGLRFAVQGGELAALAALRALEHGWTAVHAQLAADRHRAFATKWRFNRGLRALVSSPRTVDVAAFAARLAPALLRAVIARAGDCNAL